MNLDTPLSEVRGIGPKLEAKYKRLGLTSAGQLINYYPKRYDDFSKISPLASIKPGPVTIEVKITSVNGRYLRRGMHLTEAIARDASGSVRLIWFNQPYRRTSLKKDTSYYVSGTYELRHQRFSIINPAIELKSAFPVNTARLVPKYAETKGLSSRDIRTAIKQLAPLINTLDETLPSQVIDRYKLMGLAQALSAIHFPGTTSQLAKAKRRLGFEELLAIILASLMNRLSYKTDKTHIIEFKKDLATQFVSKLSFKLTDDQRRAIWQIYLDMSKSEPMNRLIEGDVGSGKTVVAAMAGLMVIAEGRQVALMAPSELLARQHADTIYKLLKPLALEDQVCLLIGALSAKQKQLARQSIASGQAKFIIGTHALIQETIDMHSLSLAVIDEQHRFGVSQRQALSLKAKTKPHILSLSATPIPRSLALTLFGELDITRLNQLPEGRQPITTKIISNSEYTRLTEKLKQELKKGNQMFIVCPTIDSDGHESLRTVNSVLEQTKKDFKQFRVGLVHGKLPSQEKALAMAEFANHQLDILVATTVIEVGIDIPNATTMVIMSSESFGLAQLHQLRGRVGRGTKAGHCYLVIEDGQPPSRRLRAMESSTNGFDLAELDLSLRGPGAIYGVSQHGILDLRLAELSDVKLIAEARQAANDIVKSSLDLLQYKELAQRVSNLQKLTSLN